MTLAELIELALKRRDGNQKALADEIGVLSQQLTDAKSGRQKLPAAACVELAKICELPEITAIAISELVTEKNPARRKVWAPFVEGTRRAAAWAMGAIAISATGATVAPRESQAHTADRLFVSTTAETRAPLSSQERMQQEYKLCAV